MKKLVLSIILVLAVVLTTTASSVFASNEHGDSGSENNRGQSEERRSSHEEYRKTNRIININGTITSLSSKRIKVDGKRIRLNRRTTVQGTLTVGAKVEVKAVRTDGHLLARAIIVVDPGTTPPPPVVVIPAAPSALAGTATSSTQVNLTWVDNSNNETGFKVQRADNDTFTTGLTTISVGADINAYNDTGLTAGTTYYYRVLATNTAGDSASSNSVTISTPPPSPTNQPPVLSPIGNKSVNEGQLLTFTISAADPDGDALAYSASNLPLGSSFDTATGVFSWTPSLTQAGNYAAVHFQVSDGSLTASEDIAIAVVNVNQSPVLSSIGTKSVITGTLLTFTISAIDPDGDTLAYSASNLPLGSSFDTTTRVFSWTPDSTQAGSYAAVHFQVSDGSLTDSEDITITVTATVSLVSFSANVKPIFDSVCNSCHPTAGVSWNTHAQISAGAANLGMGNSYLTTAQKAIIDTWISQGKLNN